MDKQIKKKWLKALRSGKYNQGIGKLRQKADKGDEFCCLGVLCDVLTPKKWEPYGSYYSYETSLNLLSDNIKSVTKLSIKSLNHLIEMNDTKHNSFTTIANWISKHL